MGKKMKSEKEAQSTIDPRDDIFGRSRVKHNEELLDYYKELEEFSTTAFWKRANDIEPWEPMTRYNPTIWKYSDLRDLVLKSAELVKPEAAGRRVVVLMNDSEAGRKHTASVG